jgi:uncharacterized integral membrane protein
MTSPPASEPPTGPAQSQAPGPAQSQAPGPAPSPVPGPTQSQGPGQARGPAPGPAPAQHVVRRSRVGGVWIASVLFALVLLLLLIFILENGQRADISFFGAHGHLPLGVALLLAAVLGVLLVVIPGTGRIVQLRIISRRHRGIDARRARASQAVMAEQPAPPGEPGQP